MRLNLHKIKNVFMWHLKKLLLKVWQSPTCLGGPSTKLISENKGGLDNRQPRVVKFEYPTVLSGKEKCRFRHVLLPKEWDGYPIGNE